MQKSALNFEIRAGDGSGVPLLVCNGLGAGLRTLEPLVNAVSDTAVITFDAPGIGSSARGAPYRLRGLARALDAEITALGYNQVDVLGISWGGLLAQEFALDYPRRCRKLILAATTMGSLSIPGNLYLQVLFSSPWVWWSKSLIRRLAPLIYGGELRKDKDAFFRYLDVKPANLPGFCLQLIAIAGWTSFPRLLRLKQPTLILAGKDDPLVPVVNALLMQRLIPAAQLRTLDCGHLFPFTQAAKVAAMIDDFRR